MSFFTEIELRKLANVKREFSMLQTGEDSAKSTEIDLFDTDNLPGFATGICSG